MNDFQALAQKYMAAKKAQQDPDAQNTAMDADVDSDIYNQVINKEPNLRDNPSPLNHLSTGMDTNPNDQRQGIPLLNPNAYTPTAEEDAAKSIANYPQAAPIQIPKEIPEEQTPQPDWQSLLAQAQEQEPNTKEEAPAKEEPSDEEEPSPKKDAETPSPKKAVSDRRYTLNELEAKQKSSQMAAQMLATQMNGFAIANSAVGKPINLEGFKAQIATHLADASNYRELIDEQRNEAAMDMKKQYADVDIKKANMQLDDEKAQKDPNSEISKATQGIAADVLGKMGMDPSKFEGMSYSSITGTMKALDPIISAKLRSDALLQSKEIMANEMHYRSDQMKMDKADRQATREAQAQTLQNHQDDQMTLDVMKRMEPMVASSRSGLGKAQAVAMAADRVKAYLKDYGTNYNKLNDIDMAELARSVDTMISGGSSTVSGATKLTPFTGPGAGAKIVQWLTGDPTGAQQGAFVKRFMSATDAEKENALRAIGTYHKTFKTGLEGTDFYKRRKDQIDNYLNAQTQQAGVDYLGGQPFSNRQLPTNPAPPTAGGNVTLKKGTLSISVPKDSPEYTEAVNRGFKE